MRFRKATPAGPRPPRPARLPRVHPPKLHQPRAHVTAMVGAAALVSLFAAATPSLQGSFAGGDTAATPAGALSTQNAGAAIGASPASGAVVPGTPSYTTTVTPPPNTVVRTGAGNVATVQYTGPNTNSDLASPLAGDGIPVTALEAYQHAANTADAADPNCHLPWPLLAGIGRVESDHGRYGGAVLRPDGTSTRPIIGIPLDGHGTEVVTDTDGGSIDGDPVFDHAVGPMQFIPSTWARYGADGNGDGLKDPFNIFDAALAAADYLCAAGGNLATTAGQTRAVLTYNHSTAYLTEVLALEHAYASGAPGLIIPAAPVVVPPVPVQHPGGRPVPPPADPGPPLGLPTGGSHHRTHHHGTNRHGTAQPTPSTTSPGGRGSSSSSGSTGPGAPTPTSGGSTSPTPPPTPTRTSPPPSPPPSTSTSPSCPASSASSPSTPSGSASLATAPATPAASSANALSPTGTAGADSPTTNPPSSSTSAPAGPGCS